MLLAGASTSWPLGASASCCYCLQGQAHPGRVGASASCCYCLQGQAHAGCVGASASCCYCLQGQAHAGRVGASASCRFEERIARSEQLRLAHLAAVVQRANDEARKVAEVAFINQLLEEDKKLSLLQKLKEGA